MASSLGEITSDPSQPDWLTAFATLPRRSSASEQLAHLECSRRWALTVLHPQLSDFARRLKIGCYPTDGEDLVQFSHGGVFGYVSECKTRGGQSPTLQAFGGHGSILLQSPRRISRGEFNGLAHVHSAIDVLEGEMCVPREGPSRPLGLHDWNISGEGTSTMHNHISRCTPPISEFDGIAHADTVIDIPEEGGNCVHSLDGTRPANGFSRLAILGDTLFDVSVQGAFAVGAFKTSNASSSAKDALLYLLVFLYVFGFLSALGAKVFSSSKMQMSGSAATVLGFLLTMVLILV